ncbi:polymorphic toxin-type HINT domain-containing protein [Streptomyces sp. NPDC092307]|uniref:polymorphic toxin-type HINT domain-containing protein n=1 Tax=Streptomyces sp. NPDC092307 TaxID=3366013 RepID=UPI00380D713C
MRPQDSRGSLTATDHHPFWAETRKQWTDAADLDTGDTLLTPDGTNVEIERVTRWKDLQPAYNLTVSDLHTYYVLAGTTPVLVHNASCGFIPGAIPDAAAINRGSLVFSARTRTASRPTGSGRIWWRDSTPCVTPTIGSSS